MKALIKREHNKNSNQDTQEKICRTMHSDILTHCLQEWISGRWNIVESSVYSCSVSVLSQITSQVFLRQGQDQSCSQS